MREATTRAFSHALCLRARYAQRAAVSADTCCQPRHSDALDFTFLQLVPKSPQAVVHGCSGRFAGFGLLVMFTLRR